MKSVLAVCLFAGSLSAYQATPPAASQTTPAKPPTASIDGQIFNLATGAPLKRASVRLTMMGGARRMGGPSQQMRETDETGRFSFTGLEAGRYQLSAERQGYLRANYGARKYNTSGTPLVLGADQHLADIVLKLNPQSVIAGKVLDEDGEPVANVNVRAYKVGYRNGRKQWVQAGGGTTSDIGEYRIPSLDPGRYLVATAQMRARTAFPSGNAPLPSAPDMRYAATYYPSTPQEANAAPVEVGAGAETRGIDIRLVKTQVYRVRGRVAVPGEGRNFPMVFVVSKDGTRGGPATVPARPPEYQFEITGLSPGSYIIYAQSGGRQEQSLAFQSIEVANRHVDGLVLSPAPGAAVNGSLKIDEANGAKIDTSRVSVVLRPSIDMGRPSRGRVENGAFVLSGVVPMRYSVDVNGIPDGCYVKSIYYGGREVPADGFDVAGGGTLDVTLGADAGSISATVLDKDGKPLNSATVALIPKGGAATEGRTTNETGGISFTGLRPGDYTLIAWEDIPPGAWQDPDFVKQYAGTVVKVEPRGKAAVQLKAVAAE